MIGCLSGVSLQHGTETAHWPTEQCPYHTIEAPLVFLSSNYFCAVAVILGIVLLVFLCRVAFYNWAVSHTLAQQMQLSLPEGSSELFCLFCLFCFVCFLKQGLSIESWLS